MQAPADGSTAGSADGPALRLDADGPLLAHNALSVTGRVAGAAGAVTVVLRGGEAELARCRPATAAAGEARFELAIDTSSWERGPHTLEVVATGDDDGVRRSSLALTADVQPYETPPLGADAVAAAMAEGRPAMWYEAPELDRGHVDDEHPEIRGWATSGDGIEHVLVTIDDRLRLDAMHGLPRPDLRWIFGDEVAEDCGFALRLDPSELPAGEHVITIVAVTTGGRGVGISGTVVRPEPRAGAEAVAATDVDAADTAAAAAAAAAEDLASGERFVPEIHHGMTFEAEHYARYLWAAPLVAQAGDVLDAGCGVGWGSALLARRARRVVGVDVSPFAIAESNRRHGGEAEFRQGDLLELPFEDGSFDAVVSFEAIEHVADPERALDELRRVLRPGGLLIVSSPNRGVYPDGNPFHIRELTSDELLTALDGRFAKVRLHPQQTYIASLLGSAASLELADPARELPSSVVKVVGDTPGTELYTVAVATDGDLPAAPDRVVLGNSLDQKEQGLVADMWRERSTRAEIEGARARAAAAELQARVARLERGQGGVPSRRSEAAPSPAELPAFRPLTAEGSLEDLAAGRVAMSLNEPPIFGGPCVVEGPLTVRGWAHARGGIETVLVLVDGRRHEALRPIVRTDLLAYYGPEAAEEGGFSLRLHPSELPPGAHTLAVVAIGRDGDAVGVEGEVTCRPDPLESDRPPDPAPRVDWLERRTTPHAAPASTGPYDPELHAGTAWEAEHRLRYRCAAELAGGREVLDVAGGSDWGSELLRKAGARRVAGVDRIAAELPFDDDSFDLVTWFQPGEPVGDVAATVAELRRVLRPDGLLLTCAGDDLNGPLNDAFAYVCAYRQHTALASVLTDDEDPDAPSTVRALFEDRDGMRLLLAASDQPPPALQPTAALASSDAIEHLHGLALMWESRALLAEADAAASRIEAGLASTQQEAAIRMLRDGES